VALIALMFALIRGNAMGWLSPAIVALFATAAVTLAAFVIYEPRIAAAPMADLRLFRRRSFAATGFAAFAISATVIGMISYLSLYVQNTLGYSPVEGGLRFPPWPCWRQADCGRLTNGSAQLTLHIDFAPRPLITVTGQMSFRRLPYWRERLAQALPLPGELAGWLENQLGRAAFSPPAARFGIMLQSDDLQVRGTADGDGCR
jgi:hypothetical protein